MKLNFIKFNKLSNLYTFFFYLFKIDKEEGKKIICVFLLITIVLNELFPISKSIRNYFILCIKICKKFRNSNRSIDSIIDTIIM